MDPPPRGLPPSLKLWRTRRRDRQRKNAHQISRKAAKTPRKGSSFTNHLSLFTFHLLPLHRPAYLCVVPEVSLTDFWPNRPGKRTLVSEAMSINEILDELPRLSAQELEEISYRVQFLRALREGLKEITDGPLIPHEQVKKELAKWLSE